MGHIPMFIIIAVFFLVYHGTLGEFLGSDARAGSHRLSGYGTEMTHPEVYGIMIYSASLSKNCYCKA